MPDEDARSDLTAAAEPATAMHRHVATRAEMRVQLVDQTPELTFGHSLGNRHSADLEPPHGHAVSLGAINKLWNAEQLELVLADHGYQYVGTEHLPERSEVGVEVAVPPHAGHGARRPLAGCEGESETPRRPSTGITSTRIGWLTEVATFIT